MNYTRTTLHELALKLKPPAILLVSIWLRIEIIPEIVHHYPHLYVVAPFVLSILEIKLKGQDWILLDKENLNNMKHKTKNWIIKMRKIILRKNSNENSEFRFADENSENKISEQGQCK